MFELITQMKNDGVTLALENGALKIAGGKSAVAKWVPAIRENKTRFIAILTKPAEAGAPSVISGAQALIHAGKTSPRASNELMDNPGQTAPAQPGIDAILGPLYKAVDAGRVAERTAADLMNSLMDAEQAQDWQAFRALLERARGLTQ